MMWKTQPRSKSSNNIAYYREGSGTSLLFIHGVGLRLESWSAQLKYLKHYFDVIAIDLPGHGESDFQTSNNINIDFYTRMIKSFADEIIQKKFIIIGHSLGALIAIDYAIKYKNDCNGIVALNCVFQRSDGAMKALKKRLNNIVSVNHDEEIDATTKRWFGDNNSEHEELADYCHRWLSNCNLVGYRDAYEVFANQKGVPNELLINNTLPILFVTGRLDRNSTPCMSQQMNELSKNGIVILVEDAGHLAQMTHSNEVNNAIKSMVMKIDNGEIDK